MTKSTSSSVPKVQGLSETSVRRLLSRECSVVLERIDPANYQHLLAMSENTPREDLDLEDQGSEVTEFDFSEAPCPRSRKRAFRNISADIASMRRRRCSRFCCRCCLALILLLITLMTAAMLFNCKMMSIPLALPGPVTTAATADTSSTVNTVAFSSSASHDVQSLRFNMRGFLCSLIEDYWLCTSEDSFDCVVARARFQTGGFRDVVPLRSYEKSQLLQGVVGGIISARCSDGDIYKLV